MSSDAPNASGEIETKKPIEIEDDLLFALLDVTRLAHIYALKDSHPEELGDDFKPHKWTDEVAWAEASYETHQRLLRAACAQRGVPYRVGTTDPRNGST